MIRYAWIWPFSWYFRIKDLELQVQALTQKNADLGRQLAAESIAHTASVAGYAALVDGLMQQAAAEHKRMLECQQRWLEQHRRYRG